MHCANIFAYRVRRANFHQKMKMMNLQYFCIFMYIWRLLNLWGCFFCRKLTKPCHHARTFQLVSQQSLANIDNKNPTILAKRPAVATTVPSGTQGHRSLVYQGIRLHLRSRPSNPTTFMGLCFLSDYRQSIKSPMVVPTFNSTEKVLKFTIYDCMLRLR